MSESYSASCYIEKNNDNYHMECDMLINDNEIYAEYDGDNFNEGISHLMSDLSASILEESKPKQKEMTQEELIDYLSKQVEQLQEENQKLNCLIKEKNKYDFEDKNKQFNNDEDIKKFLEEANRIIKGYKGYSIPFESMPLKVIY